MVGGRTPSAPTHTFAARPMTAAAARDAVRSRCGRPARLAALPMVRPAWPVRTPPAGGFSAPARRCRLVVGWWFFPLGATLPDKPTSLPAPASLTEPAAAVPAAVAAGEAAAAVQPSLAVLPELDRVRLEQVAAPVRRPRHRAVAEALLGLARGCPSAPATNPAAGSGRWPMPPAGSPAGATRSRRPTRASSSCPHPSLHPHLAAGRLPVEDQRRPGVRGQLRALAAVAVGVEAKAGARRRHAAARSARTGGRRCRRWPASSRRASARPRRRRRPSRPGTARSGRRRASADSRSGHGQRGHHAQLAVARQPAEHRVDARLQRTPSAWRGRRWGCAR